MNYLCHARDCVERPYALAGTALPDWLRVLVRRDRFDPKSMPLTEEGDRSIHAEMIRGVRAHYTDDRWFHDASCFQDVSRAVTAHIRRAYPDPYGTPRPRRIRASFYGHILLELLLDAFLMEQRPDFVDRYYAALDRVDAAEVQAFAAAHLGREPERLDELIEGFRRYPFLRTYLDDGEVCDRLDQVSRRVRLPPLPRDFAAVVGFARGVVRENGQALLTAPGA